MCCIPNPAEDMVIFPQARENERADELEEPEDLEFPQMQP